MKLLSTLIIVAATVLLTGEDPVECKRPSKKEIKSLLGGYLYDNSMHVPVETGSRGMYQEYNFTLFRKPNYKFAFETKGGGMKVVIELFKVSGSKQVKIFDSRERDADNNEYHVKVDEPVKNYTIRYTIPAETPEGCINMALGYKYQKEDFSKRKGRVRIVD